MKRIPILLLALAFAGVFFYACAPAPLEPEDMACIPKEHADNASSSQPEDEAPPDEMPPPPVVNIDDPLPEIPREPEHEEEPEVRPEQALPIGDGSTSREVIEAVGEKEKEAGAPKESVERLEEVAKADEMPVCENTRRGDDPGQGGEQANSMGMREAYAQSPAQPIAVVDVSSRASEADVRSMAGAWDKQRWTQFSKDWWPGYVYYASSASQIGSGSWPVFLVDSDPAGYNFAYHTVGPWPYPPYTYSPYSIIPDAYLNYSSGEHSKAGSHEINEMSSNPWLTWKSPTSAGVVGRSGTIYVGWESSDPVYTYTYNITSYYDGRNWTAADYVLRNYYQDNSSPPWTRMGKDTGYKTVPGAFKTWGCPLFNLYHYPTANSPSSNTCA